MQNAGLYNKIKEFFNIEEETEPEKTKKQEPGNSAIKFAMIKSSFAMFLLVSNFLI